MSVVSCDFLFLRHCANFGQPDIADGSSDGPGRHKLPLAQSSFLNARHQADVHDIFTRSAF
jgi:hypothetical protein